MVFMNWLINWTWGLVPCNWKAKSQFQCLATISYFACGFQVYRRIFTVPYWLGCLIGNYCIIWTSRWLVLLWEAFLCRICHQSCLKVRNEDGDATFGIQCMKLKYCGFRLRLRLLKLMMERAIMFILESNMAPGFC